MPEEKTDDKAAEQANMRRGIGCLVAVLLVVLLVVGLTCTFLYRSITGLKESKDPLSEGSLYKLCSKVYYPDAAPYAGPAPHPMVIAVRVEGKSTSSGWIRSGLHIPAAPKKGEEIPEYWNTSDELSAQLVTCLDEPETGERLGECDNRLNEYTGDHPRRVTVYQGVYRGAVYEARTGKTVAEVELRGASQYRQRNSDFCKDVNERDKASGAVHTLPDFAEYRRVLGRYVEE